MPPSRLKLIRAHWVAPMDRPVIRDGAVVVQDDLVLDVGDAGVLARSHPDADEVELGDAVVLPGLINAHAHLELSDTPRPGEQWDGPLADWLIEVIKHAPPERDAARVTRAIDVGVRQCLKFGVTTVADITRQPALTRPLLKASPLRIISFGEVQAMAGRRHLLPPRLAAAVDRTHETDRLRIGVSPHAPYSIDADGYAACADAADRLSCLLTTHLAESPDEAEFLRSHTGPFRRIWDFLNAWADDGLPHTDNGPIDYLRGLQYLTRHVILAHVNYCCDQELSMLAAGQASVVYCPRTHAYFGHPLHRWRDMLRAGVNVALGTDSLASSPDLNLLDDLSLVRQIAPDVPAQELWQLVTTRAARALHMEAAVGTITPGKQADFVSFPISAHSADPLDAVLRESVTPTGAWIAGERAGDDLR